MQRMLHPSLVFKRYTTYARNFSLWLPFHLCFLYTECYLLYNMVWHRLSYAFVLVKRLNVWKYMVRYVNTINRPLNRSKRLQTTTHHPIKCFRTYSWTDRQIYSCRALRAPLSHSQQRAFNLQLCVLPSDSSPWSDGDGIRSIILPQFLLNYQLVSIIVSDSGERRKTRRSKRWQPNPHHIACRLLVWKWLQALAGVCHWRALSQSKLPGAASTHPATKEAHLLFYHPTGVGSRRRSAPGCYCPSLGSPTMLAPPPSPGTIQPQYQLTSIDGDAPMTVPPTTGRASGH